MLARLLTVCLVLGLLPAVGLSASAANLSVVGGNLQAAYDAANPGDTILLTGDVTLTAPLYITKDITIAGSGTIKPNGDKFYPGLATDTMYNTMLVITAGNVD